MMYITRIILKCRQLHLTLITTNLSGANSIRVGFNKKQQHLIDLVYVLSLKRKVLYL